MLQFFQFCQEKQGGIWLIEYIIIAIYFVSSPSDVHVRWWSTMELSSSLLLSLVMYTALIFPHKTFSSGVHVTLCLHLYSYIPKSICTKKYIKKSYTHIMNKSRDFPAYNRCCSYHKSMPCFLSEKKWNMKDRMEDNSNSMMHVQ